MNLKYQLLLVILFSTYTVHAQQKKIWLDELDLSHISSGWKAPQARKAVDNNTIRIAGKRYAHGVGTHATSLIPIELHGTATRFYAEVGIDDKVAKAAAQQKGTGQASFSVLADGKLIYFSDTVSHSQPARVIDLDVRGVKNLYLLADQMGPSRHDHVDFADAYLLYEGKAPNIAKPPAEAEYILTPKASKSPLYNGPRVFATRPSYPVHIYLAFSGAKPLTVTADSLPLGLEYNPKTRNLTGFVAKVGTYTMTFKGSNAFGTTYVSTRMVIGDTLARTPIMGWNSWNCWGMDVSAERVKQAAVAIKQSGLADYGFRYVNIDDGWQAGRNAIGEIIPNDKFPNMRYLADTVHSLGLRIGLYSSPGPLTCNKLMGSYQHEAQDAATYSNWQIDFLKYDMCSYSQIMPRNPTRADEMKPYTLMGKLLRNQQRDIVFSLCQYGNAQVEQWGPQVKGSLWRTTGDIIDTWESVQTIIDLQYKTHPYAGPGRWNDPDMLVVGWLGWGSKLHKTRLTPSEQYYHISMWCMLSAPLILGCDLTKLDAFTKNLLTNREVIAIDQDELGRQATRTYADTSRYPWAQEQFIEVWQKPLANGDVAIGIFNRGAKEATYKLDLASLKLPPGKVRDLWRQKDVLADAVVTIPRHGCALFRVGKGM